MPFKVNPLEVIFFTKTVKYEPLGYKRYKMSNFEWHGHVWKITMIIVPLRG